MWKMMYYFMLFVQLISLANSGDISEDALQSLHCELGIGDNGFCPIDGGWTTWNAWSACSGECGSRGKKMRIRSCNNPVPSNNGAPCIGPSYQTDTCKIIVGCTVNDYEKVVKNHPIRREEMKIVKAIHERLPALDELCFSIDCTFPIVRKILGRDAMIYWNAMNCVKYNTGCPIPGGWSHWEPWLPCTAVCGKGEMYRIRTCNSPKPSDTELTCDGLAFETKTCTGFNCRKHLSGTWSNWNAWSSCSVQCGIGLRTRKRSCTEFQNENIGESIEEGTSCEGTAKEIEACGINNCSVDGGWSSWSTWTTCSSDCGVGTQFRNRMCSNPFPSDNAAGCSGLASEIRQCFNKPCTVRSHEVAHFTGESSLLYTARDKPSRLLHVYLRFLPLSSFGVLLHRFKSNCVGPVCDFVKVYLWNGKIVFLSRISGCTLALIYEDKLQTGLWHEVLVLICGTYAILRVDDGYHKTASFSCIPTSQNLDHSMKLGEGFHGQIQKLAINFASAQLHLPKVVREVGNEHVPYSSSDVQYLMGDVEEGSLHVTLTQSLAAPCPKHNVTIALKTKNINGGIAIMNGDSRQNYVLLTLEEGRVKLKLHQGTSSVVIESTEHISAGEWIEVILVHDSQNWYMQINGNKKNYVPTFPKRPTVACKDNIFIGAIRDEIKKAICPKCERVPQMSFTIGYLEIDGILLDLLSLPAVETTSNRFASRTISFPNYYEEITLFLGQQLKLACLYDKIPKEQKIHSKFISKTYVKWLLIDAPMRFSGNTEELFTLADDGRVSSVTAASYKSRSAIENFYSCYVRHYKNMSMILPNQAIFTFGVAIIDEHKEFENVSWKKWGCIFGTILICLTVMIVLYTLEAVWDIRIGHGFYRLPRMVSKNDSIFVVNFILSTDGVKLLGNQQAADEIAERVVESSQKLLTKVKDGNAVTTDAT